MARRSSSAGVRAAGSSGPIPRPQFLIRGGPHDDAISRMAKVATILAATLALASAVVVTSFSHEDDDVPVGPRVPLGAGARPGQPIAMPADLVGLEIALGLKDSQPTEWEGDVKVSQGPGRRARGRAVGAERGGRGDALQRRDGQGEGQRPRRRPRRSRRQAKKKQARPPPRRRRRSAARAVLRVTLEAPADATVTVTTGQGEFARQAGRPRAGPRPDLPRRPGGRSRGRTRRSA